MNYRIRRGRAGDAALMVDVEQDAAYLFRSAAGLEWIADQPGTSAETYVALIAGGSVWCAEVERSPCGFVAARVELPDLHIVECERAARASASRLARRLIEAAAKEAQS